MKRETFRALFPNAPEHARTDGDQELFPAHNQLRLLASRSVRLTAETPGLNKPSLISSYKGAIDRILFSFPRWAVEKASFVAAYKSVIAALRPGTKFVVVCVETDRSAIEAWFNAANHDAENIEWAHLPNYTSFTDWAEDAYVGVVDTDDDVNYLVEPWSFPRYGDALIADAVSDYATDIKSVQSPLMFQGGNCIVLDDHWFMGRDYFFDCVDLLRGERPPVATPSGQSESEFIGRLFKNYFDAERDMVLLGAETPILMPSLVAAKENGEYYLDAPTFGTGAYQPIFHIDMLMTGIGDLGHGGMEVMVGDPNLADQILSTQTPYSMPEQFDLIAAQLADLGYKVHRNPIVLRPSIDRSTSLSAYERTGERNDDEILLNACVDLRRLGATDETSVHSRIWYHISWNNCLVENSTEHGRHVYMPTFGYSDRLSLNVVDHHMKETWEQLGFTVHMLADFDPFARRRGVVHCISKYLSRSERPATQ